MKTAMKTKFKHTEIGTLPSDWEVAKFRAILSGNIRHGIYKPKESADPRGVRLLKMGDVNSNDRISDQNMERVFVSEDELERFRINDGNLIFARTSMMTGGLGNCSIVMKHNDPIIFDGNLLCAEIDPNIAEPEFYLYYFESKRGQEEIAKMTTGTQSRNIPGSNLMEANVPILNKYEQGQIASVLSRLESKIELNRKMNKTLEAIAQAIFKHWFVRFEFPNEEGKPYKSSGGEMAPSELGELPKGWRAVSFLDAFDINPPRSLIKGQVAPYVEMANMPNDSARVLGHVDRQFTSGTRFIDGDTLVARITPCLENGKTAFVDFVGEGRVGWGSTEYIILRPKRPLPLEFGYFLARTEYFRTHAISNMTGTSGRQRVPVDCLNNFMFVNPAAQIAGHFGKFARICMQFMKKNDDESKTLGSIRDMLLPKLMSGKIRVPV